MAFAAGTVFEEGDFALPARFEARSDFSGAPPPPVPFFLALPEGAGGAFAFAGGRILVCATGVVTPRTAIVAPRSACASLQGRAGNR
jgi:hypothetical protein